MDIFVQIVLMQNGFAKAESVLMDTEKTSLGIAKILTNNFTPADIELTETLYCLFVAE